MRLWWDYSLSKAALFMRSRWEMRGHVLVVGPLFFCVGWRRETPGGLWLNKDGVPQEPTDPGFFTYLDSVEAMSIGTQR